MNSKTFLAVGICILAMLFSAVDTSVAYTGGGAWGGGSLGFGGGSWGASRGGLGSPVRNLLANQPVRSLLANRPTPFQNLAANRPVRSLLGRVRDRLATAVGNIGAVGAGSAGNFGSVGFGGCIGNGSWGGSGGYGSAGNVSWNAPSYGCVGSSTLGGTISSASVGGGYIAAAPAIELSSFASSPVFDIPVASSFPTNPALLEAPIAGFAMPAYAAPELAFTAPIASAPPIMPTFAGPVNAGNPFDCAYCPQSMPIYADGIPAGVIPGDLSGAGGLSSMPAEGSTIPGGTNFGGAPGAGEDPYYDGISDPNSVLEGGGQAAPLLPSEGGGDFPMPSPTDGDTSINRSERLREAVLNVALPLDAKVYVNEKLTKTPGQIRSYVSRNLEPNRNYTYNLKVVAVRDGQPVEFRRKIVMRAGQKQQVKFDFETPIRTKVSLRVPANATIELAGNKTKSTKATLRHFETTLKPGQTWDDYKVIVTYEQGGKKVTREHTLNVVAGKQYVLDFQSEKSVNMFVSK